MTNNNQLATFGGGCFWCVEAIFQRLKGVDSVTSGYAGGHTDDPTYRSIGSGLTGHAEVIQVSFDPEVISYEDLVTIFMTSHNPTTRNRQGADHGTQYRSIVLFHDESQHKTAREVFAAMDALYTKAIVTELKPLDRFYPAEAYHQDYYNNNSSAGYCRVVIDPKLQKLRRHYADKLKVDTAAG
jgi:peptide-methionine (S)-S-oxide reductase